jgi:TetR/AcrR family acrAB operon transcriptional repressor
MSPKIVDKKGRRREILRAATQLVARRGIRDVTITDIARAAGVGKGTIYEYFTGKGDIYSAVILEYLDMAETAAAREMFHARSPREKLAALLGGWLKSTEDETDDTIMLFIDVWSEAIRGTDPELDKAFDLRSFFHRYRDYVASILQEAIDRDELAPMNTAVVAGSLLGLFDGIMLQWLLDRDNVDLHETLDTVLDVIWRGLAADRGQR